MPAPALAPVLRYLHSAVEGDPSLADALLLQRFVGQGDVAAFELLLRRHGPMVLGVCRRLLRDANDAEDAFQATFLVLLRRAGSLRQPDQLAPWLYGVALRVARKARARADRRRQRELPLAEPTPKQARAASDLGAWLDDAVERLPRRYREPVVLCYLQGLTHAEAARQLGCPPGTLATRLARARDRLRRQLTQRGLQALPAGLSPILPSALRNATLRAATSLVSGEAIPSSLAPLTEGVCNAMLPKWKIVLVLLALGVVAAGTSPALNQPAAIPPPPAPPAPLAPEEARPATIRTANFAVHAPSRRIARLVAEAAERHRKALALRWLGRELPAWPAPCPLTVRITFGGSGGATSFAFDNGRILSRDMRLEGSLESILSDCLPHEITHAVLADHFRRPIPRWADEGAAILAEGEQSKHERLTRKILDTPGRAIPLRRLFALKEYPADVMVLYAQGHSVTRFLVDRKDRQTFLAFVAQGSRRGWDGAVKTHYGLRDVDELEAVWLAHLRRARKADTTEARPGEASKLPTSPAPVVATVQVDKEGKRLVLGIPRSIYRPVTAYHQRPGEAPTPVTAYELVTQAEERTCDLAEVRVYGTDGKEVDRKNLAGRLRVARVVLMSADGRPVAPYHLQLTRPDALVLVLPIPVLPMASQPPAPPPAVPRR